MKRLLLSGMTALALASLHSGAEADPIIFDYTGSLVPFTVPTTGLYQLIAFGAQGASSTPFAGFVGAGGRGAEIGGTFSLTAGEILQIAVGGTGIAPGAGGGGSFVVGPGNMPLVVAGGGGGGGAFQGGPLPGQGGLIGPDGGFGGGINGNGGAGGSVGVRGAGGGGGGFFTPGGNGVLFGGTGGGAFPDLAGGISGGGFGGGGGAAGAAGGGGGYSGGAGAGSGIMGFQAGGGGGSFDGGTDQILIADFQPGNGQVIITELAVELPEPASSALLGIALVGAAAITRRRRRG